MAFYMTWICESIILGWLKISNKFDSMDTVFYLYKVLPFTALLVTRKNIKFKFFIFQTPAIFKWDPLKYINDSFF